MPEGRPHPTEAAAVASPTAVTFLLGPAGSGKTWRCRQEILAELQTGGEGPPLIVLAPRQATYQWERSILSDPAISGYTRLQVLSFERLAEWCLDWKGTQVPRLLSEQGRVMVIRALVLRHAGELRLFQRSSRQSGFAQELSSIFREVQQARLGADRLLELARDFPDPLGAKLHDVGLLMQKYQAWLKERGIEDGDRLLELATATLRKAKPFESSEKPIGGLWLDGFADLTVQESELLSALLPYCGQSTLAFCLEKEPVEELSWLSTWAPLSQTFRALKTRLSVEPGLSISTLVLERNTLQGRFAQAPALAALELGWSAPARSVSGSGSRLEGTEAGRNLAVLVCANLEAEAEAAAAEILRAVRDGGVRYRETAVLMRSLTEYHAIVRRVFRQHGIPFFLDRRESAGHHPLVELLRSSLKLACGGWRQVDFFAALKTGLLALEISELDWLENEALARGWEGGFWRRPIELPSLPSIQQSAEQIRSRVVPPLAAFVDAVSAEGGVEGLNFASAVTRLWEDLQIEKTLEGWESEAETGAQGNAGPASFHRTVLRELNEWLEDIRIGLGTEQLSLADWATIVEAGLSGLTAGVIPPSLDQVLVGAIDRARNPDLKLLVVLGLNESVFPAPPVNRGLFTEMDRDLMDRKLIPIGSRLKRAIGLEWFYGYIAFTRSTERVVATFSEKDGDGAVLHPSPFIAHLRRIIPGLQSGRFVRPATWWESDRLEDALPAMRSGEERLRAHWPGLVRGRVEQFNPTEVFATASQSISAAPEHLSPGVAKLIHGETLRTSVSRLETFAACPFRFFVNATLRADERREFTIDARESGSLQHEILAIWHEQVIRSRGSWRNIEITEARKLIEEIGEQRIRSYGDGRFLANPRTEFAGKALVTLVGDWIEACLRWLPGYSLEPWRVETPFGMKAEAGEKIFPAWTLELGDGLKVEFRGKIDRLDLGPADEQGIRPLVVIDYKMSGKKPDDLRLANGIQMQLAAYMAAARELPGLATECGARQLEPIGGFYANLRGNWTPAKSRDEADEEGRDAWQSAYRHYGRFNKEWIGLLDAGFPDSQSGQFNYRVKGKGKDRSLAATPRDAMEATRFRAMLGDVEELLREFGKRILQGDVAVDPFRKGAERACDHCEYSGVCRIDKNTHNFRSLRKPEAADETGGEA